MTHCEKVCLMSLTLTLTGRLPTNTVRRSLSAFSSSVLRCFAGADSPPSFAPGSFVPVHKHPTHIYHQHINRADF